ncbi:Lipase, GDSL [Artemisia annua]|uniref:Lipase, GDSL n=1 Tax=Artemisia annua TaxID=35608 RepID=A0A2U1KX61_ARTAN|nr:Lipase, GDSL [Artemisia annua]
MICLSICVSFWCIWKWFNGSGLVFFWGLKVTMFRSIVNPILALKDSGDLIDCNYFQAIRVMIMFSVTWYLPKFFTLFFTCAKHHRSSVTQYDFWKSKANLQHPSMFPPVYADPTKFHLTKDLSFVKHHATTFTNTTAMFYVFKLLKAKIRLYYPLINIIRITLQMQYFEQYQQRRLYELGLRRVLVTGTGPLGCVPAELAQRGRNGQCAPELQQAAALFNPQLQSMLDSLNSEIGQNVFIGANIRQTNIDFISDPARYAT